MGNKVLKKGIGALASFFLIPILMIVLISSAFGMFGSGIETGSEGEGSGNIEVGQINGDQYNFVCEIVSASYISKKENNILTSVTVAQAILESSWGKSAIALNSNNLFGMKKGSWTGPTYKGYRKYSTVIESVKDHDALLAGTKYNLANVKDLNIILGILADKYAPVEDGNAHHMDVNGDGKKDYQDKVLEIINRYNLSQFDDMNETSIAAVRNKTYVYVGQAIGGGVTNGASEKGNNIANKAMEKLGSRYWWGAPGGGYGDKQNLNSPDAKYFDCSGFVTWAHRQSGVNLPRLTAEGFSKNGANITYEQLQTGDVITFANSKNAVAYHIGIYIGNGKMIHCGGPGSGSNCFGNVATAKVQIDNITSGSPWYSVIKNCRRLY